MPKKGHYLEKRVAGKPKKMNRTVRIMLIILAVLLVILVGLVIYKIVKEGQEIEVKWNGGVVNITAPTLGPQETEITPELNNTIPKEEVQTEATESVEYTGPKVVNVLLVGQSSRDGEEAKLADTIMLVTLNKMSSTVSVTSFLRDAYVQLPSPYIDTKGVTRTCGKNKINTAYALGYSWGKTADAMLFLDQTITNNFRIEIDYNVEIDFDAFEEAVDMVNGIKLELDADEANYLNKYFRELGEDYRAVFVEGKNHLDGWDALVYARMRHSSAADNDYKRTNRQRIVIAALLDKCTRRIDRLPEMAKELMPYVKTDMPWDDLMDLIKGFAPILLKLTMESVQIPAEGTMWPEPTIIDGVMQYPQAFNAEKNIEILRAIAEADHLDGNAGD